MSDEARDWADEEARRQLPCTCSHRFCKECTGHHVQNENCPAYYRSAVALGLHEAANRAGEPPEGSWGWALVQMKAGRIVELPDDGRFISLGGIRRALGVSDSDFYCFYLLDDEWKRGSKQFDFIPADFDSVEWRIAE